MDTKKKTYRIIGGYSESTWKSLVVKSLRVGWVDGLNAASEALAPSTMKSILTNGLFEDVFPTRWEEFNECLELIDKKDYVALCQFQTHHGRDYTRKFCAMAEEACGIGKFKGYDIMQEIKANSPLRFLSQNIYNCIYTWYKINPQDKNVKRIEFRMPFNGIPECVMDSHTYEGKMNKYKPMNFLSGHYENHEIMGKNVMKYGWDYYRQMLAKDKFYPVLVQRKLEL